MSAPEPGLGWGAALALLAVLVLCLLLAGYGATEALTWFLLWIGRNE